MSKSEAHKSSLVVCHDSPPAVEKPNSQEDREEAYKYLNTLQCVLFFQDVKFVLFPGSVKTMFRNRACL